MALTWQKYQGEPSQFESYILEYREKKPSDQESEITNLITMDDSIFTNSNEVTGLKAATSYQVRVSVKTEDFGYSPPSDWMNFQTMAIGGSQSEQAAAEKTLQGIVSNLANIKNCNKGAFINDVTSFSGNFDPLPLGHQFYYISFIV